MSGKLTESETTDLKEAFQLFDKDGDGRISIEEVKTVVSSLQQDIDEDQLQEMFNEVDTDGSGSIELEEFVQMMCSYRGSWQDPELEMKQAFKMFDKDGDGVISATELRSVMASLGESMTREEVEELIKDADIDGDNQVNYEEFVTMMSAKM
ncbi:unnamed protein product [Owenia fusiformis]|uniref:Uncharacterized protein n=1 Tax=Owenia fusiformis TaxID=6347 RepID=A0A8J1U7S2_OWEFU|nr:unnamed protein product [Owenia fusiformis]